MAKYEVRKNPRFSACGLNCGLCPRYYTEGSSRCPGCGGEGFLETHCSCSILPCCERKGVEYCFDCDEYPCKRYVSEDLYDSFISHKNQIADMKKAKRIGIDFYMSELNEKIDILKYLLDNYNDGRRKSFYCNAVNLLDLHDIKKAMERIENEVKAEMSLKEKSNVAVKRFNEIAEHNGVSLKLRKK